MFLRQANGQVTPLSVCRTDRQRQTDRHSVMTTKLIDEYVKLHDAL